MGDMSDDLVPVRARCTICRDVTDLEACWVITRPGEREPDRVCGDCWDRSRRGVPATSDQTAIVAAYRDAHPDLDAHRDAMEAVAAAARAERLAIQEVVLLELVRADLGG